MSPDYDTNSANRHKRTIENHIYNLDASYRKDLTGDRTCFINNFDASIRINSRGGNYVQRHDKFDPNNHVSWGNGGTLTGFLQKCDVEESGATDRELIERENQQTGEQAIKQVFDQYENFK